MGRLERAFQRYRRRGDAAALGRVFDGAAPELLGVALHLAPDPAEAEDLVQATFLAAIEGAAGWEAGRPLRPWLLGILVKQAARARRSAARRPDPERLAERTAEDPEHRALDGEVRAAVEEALGKLPVAYRETLRRHLLHGERAVEIARTLGQAPGTVRMRILRGLELLKRGLPAGIATGGALLLAPVRGHAAVRAAVLEHAAAVGPALAAAAPAPLVLGGLAMSAKAALLATVAGSVFLGGFALWDGRAPVSLVDPDPVRGGGEAPADLAVLPAPRASVPAPAEARVPVTSAVAPAAARAVPDEPREPAPDAPGWWLVGHVTGFPSDVEEEPLVHVHDFAVDGYTYDHVSREGGAYAVDLAELFEVDGPSARELLVSVDHPDHLTANEVIQVAPDFLRRDPDQRAEIRRNFVLRPAARVSGRLAGPDGFDPRRASVALFEAGADDRPAREPVREFELKENGSFELDKRAPGDYFVVARADGLLPRTVRVRLAAAEHRDLGTLRLVAGETAISGRAVLASGEPLAGMTVRARSLSEEVEELPWGGLLWQGREHRALEQAARTGADGRFRIGGLRPGLHRVRLEDGDAGMVIGERAGREVVAPAEGVLLGDGAALITVLVTTEDEPTPGADVFFHTGHGTWGTTCGDDGTVTVVGSLSEDYRVDARAGENVSPEIYETLPKGELASRELALPASGRPVNASYALELEPTAARRAVLVLDPGPPVNPPLDGVTALLRSQGEGEGEGEEHRLEATLADGLFRIEDVPPGRWRVSVEPSEQHYGLYYASYLRIEELEVDLEGGEEERHPLELSMGGRIAIEVHGALEEEDGGDIDIRDAKGRQWVLRLVRRSYQDNVLSIGAWTGGIPLSGRVEGYPNLPPGAYHVRIEAEGYAAVQRTVSVVPGQTSELVVHLRRRD